ncbi:MAG: PAS domain S-box protein [Melioribacteraceae bacterium]|nr:PAS domain S-box protein [Melioribacteraceae bacterium]
MDHKLEDIVDVKLLQELQEKLNVIYSFPSAIIDNDGKVLTAVAWQDICTKFHRINPESEKECIKSDHYIFEHLKEANPAVSYKCPHGLVDNATPIIIDGKHYGNFFTGQFFLETKPDMEFFRQQAKKFGFDEASYLEAVQKVPVWSEEKLHQYLDFIKGFIDIIAGIGIKNLKEIEVNRNLNESEKRFKAIVECTSDWVWEIDEKGKYCFCSENVENLLGYKAEEILGKTPFDLMLPEDVEKNKKAFFDILAAKDAIEDFENWNLHKDGRKICLLTNGFPIFDEKGNVIGYKGADKDITERKQNELLLQKKSEEIAEQNEKLLQTNLELIAAKEGSERKEVYLQTLLSVIEETIVSRDLNNEVVYFNKAFDNTTRNIFNEPAFVGMNTLKLLPKEAKEFWEDILLQVKNGKINSYEYEFPTIDNKVNYYVTSHIPIRYDKKIIGTLEITKDISNYKQRELELKTAKLKAEESEERFKLAMRASNDGLFDWNLETNEIYYSPAWKKMLGYEDHELPNDFSVWENSTDPGDVKKSLELQQKLISRQIDRFETEFRMKHKDGHWVDILSRAEAIFNDNGKAIRMIGTHVDITERKLVEETLRISESRYALLIQNLDAGIVIHAPDTSIIMNNQRASEILGLSDAQLRGKAATDPSWRFVNEQRIPLTHDEYPVNRVLANKQPIKDQLVGIHQPGQSCFVWATVSGFPVLNESGEITEILISFFDITEQKQAEIALSNKERYQRALLDNFPFAVWLKDTESRFLAVNQTFANTFKVPSADMLIGKTDFDIAIQSVAELYRANDRAVMLSRQKQVNEEIVAGLGELNWAETYKAPVVSESGELLGTVGFFRDISERKLAEQALIKSEAIKNAMVSNLSDVIVIIDKNGINKYKSPNVTKLFGWNPEELVGKNTWDNIHPDDLEAGQKFLGTILTEPNATGTTELRYKRKDGNYVWIEISVINLLHDKYIDGILGNYKDITERKQAEVALAQSRSELKAIYEYSPVMMCLVDENRQIIFANPAFTTLTGTTEEFLKGGYACGVFGCINAMDDVRGCGFGSNCQNCQLRIAMDDTLKNGTGHTNVEYHTTLLHNGETRKVSLLGSTALIESDSHRNLLLCLHDITERKQAEIDLESHRNHLEDLVKVRTDELEKANDSLRKVVDKERELNELKSRFLSTTSHEFRTPLTAVLSSTELLQRFGTKWSDEKKDEHYNRIITSVEYLTKLLDDILTLNRAESGKISYQPEPVDLHKLAEECLKDAKLFMNEKHEPKFNYKSKQKEFQLDPKLMKFVFNNLLSNAAKYSPQGGLVELKISLNKMHILIQVSDEGIGVPPEDLDKIFEAFYRTKTTNEIAGTGLGLSIVKRAVDFHGGEIKVESKLGEGTRFLVQIPILESK